MQKSSTDALPKMGRPAADPAKLAKAEAYIESRHRAFGCLRDAASACGLNYSTLRNYIRLRRPLPRGEIPGHSKR